MYYKPVLKSGIPYDQVVSGLQKMIRRGKEKEAMILGLTLFNEGYNVALARRLMAIAAEDIGLANPSLVAQVHSIASAFIIGKKESKSGFVEWNPLGLLIMLMCRSPKNREVDDAWVVLTDKLKSGEESAAKVISENYSLCVDGHTDEGKANLRKLAEANCSSYEEESWKKFLTEGALLSPHVEIENNPWGRQVCQLKGLDYEKYLRGFEEK